MGRLHRWALAGDGAHFVSASGSSSTRRGLTEPSRLGQQLGWRTRTSSSAGPPSTRRNGADEDGPELAKQEVNPSDAMTGEPTNRFMER